MVLRKHYLEQIRPFIGTDVIKVVTGIRRCGKSVFLEQVRDEILRLSPKTKVISVDLEDKANERFLKEGVLFNYLESELKKRRGAPTAIFLDEIHDVESWETTVNTIRKRKGADVYITGSNSKLLSGELATYLTGRYVEFPMAPFSYGEYVEAVKGVAPETGDALFMKYVETGGMPFLPQLGFGTTGARQYLDDLFWAILSKDIMRRKEIRDVDLLERIVRYAMTEIGHVFSASSIARFLKHEKRVTTAETILNYLAACEEAFLLSRVKREDLIGKRILSVDEKFYVTDLGLRRAVIGDRRGEDVDQALENVVYCEMRRRGYEVTVGRVKEKEVDFVCSRDGKRLYLQVAYLMPTAETREREFGALLTVPDQYRKLVLSMDNFDFSRDGIEHVRIPDFILNEDV
jgi:uncharacterized protein